MSDEFETPFGSTEEAELVLLKYIEKALIHDADSPLDVVKIDLSLLESLIMVLGLNALVADKTMPDVVRRKCGVLVQRLTADIGEQKTKGQSV